MAGKSESIEAFSGNKDWDTPFHGATEQDNGKANPKVADLNAMSFSETTRTPYRGTGVPRG
jgi:hypothetical protein